MDESAKLVVGLEASGNKAAVLEVLFRVSIAYVLLCWSLFQPIFFVIVPVIKRPFLLVEANVPIVFTKAMTAWRGSSGRPTIS